MSHCGQQVLFLAFASGRAAAESLFERGRKPDWNPCAEQLGCQDLRGSAMTDVENRTARRDEQRSNGREARGGYSTRGDSFFFTDPLNTLKVKPQRVKARCE